MSHTSNPDWRPTDEFLHTCFFDPDVEEMNKFISKALEQMLGGGNPKGVVRPVSSVEIQFLKDVLECGNAEFKLYAVLMLIRSDPEIWECIKRLEPARIGKRFLPALAKEFNLFGTGFRPMTMQELLKGGPIDSATPMEYVKDDPEKLEYHTAEYVVFRLGCLYRAL